MRTGASIRLIALGASVAWATSVAGATTIEIQYPYEHLYKTTFEKIAADFKEAHPDIELKFRAPYEDYEQASQSVLKEAITDKLPDVTWQGLNRIRILVDKKIAQPLEPFIAKEAEFEKDGYHQAMLDLGTFNEQVHALPFAVSLPIVYYNMDLVKQAGWDPEKLPATWDEVFELSAKIGALSDDIDGMFFGWIITGNWFWQAVNLSQGGTMLDAAEKQVAFGGEAGQYAMNNFARMVTEAKMPLFTNYDDSFKPFTAGKMGVFFWSTSLLARMTEWVGDKFELKTGPWPSVKPEVGRLPAGGTGAIMLTTDEEKQAAAWEFIKFATSGEGAAWVAKTTGYMPPNKKANEVYLKDFYDSHPNNSVAVKQLPYLTDWYAFPGKNGLKITKVIRDHEESIATGQRAGEPDKVLEDMVNDVQKLLPQ